MDFFTIVKNETLTICCCWDLKYLKLNIKLLFNQQYEYGLMKCAKINGIEKDADRI